MKLKKNTSHSKSEPVFYNILDDDTPWAIKEAYNTMRTNITLSLPNDSHRTIAFTSAEPHDGKTTNAINFALSLAQTDKRVLLIDCDLRKPMIAKILNIESSPGLTDVVSGQVRIRDVLAHNPKYNIDIIPSGTITPDPTLLLQSKSMELVMQELKKIYEYIIIDLPPVTVVTDASILASLIDGFLLVVRHEETDYRSVSSMMEQLELANARIIGFIYNGARSSEDRYYKNGYRYKYNYKYNDE